MKASIWLALLALLFMSCSDDSSGNEYSFERSVLEFTAVKRCSDRAARPGDPCYMLKWRHPIERTKLLRYHIWIDTLVVNDTIRDVPEEALTKSIQIPYGDGRGDYDSLDLTSYLSAYLDRDSLHVAIWAEYGDGGSPGSIQRLYLFFGDDIAPGRVQFTDSTNQNTLWLGWSRPTDQQDFYFPDSVSGPIAGYNLHLYAEDANQDLRNLKVQLEIAGGDSLASGDTSAFRRHSRFRYRDGMLMVDTTASGVADKSHLRFVILDGKGFASETAKNRYRLRIDGLKPQSYYGVSLSVWDSAGNSTGTTDADASGRRILTTDTVEPLIATRFWLRSDTVDGGKPRLDSNRLVLYWPRSVDPLVPRSGIVLDSLLSIPSGCLANYCYREVASYKVDLWNGTAWESASRAGGSVGDKYNIRYARSGDTLKENLDGMYVTDTLRWVTPGDTLIVRVRAVDSSGYISKALVDTIVASRGALWNVSCPPSFVPVSRTVSGVTETYCVEKNEHSESGTYMRNVIYQDARATCQAMAGQSGFAGFQVDLCREDQWRSACLSQGRSRYGVIEDAPFSALEFLFQNCNVGTWDSTTAADPTKRNPICKSPDGVRDLPGNLQEWAIGTETVTDSITKKTRIDTIAVLKGTSYVLFDGADRTELAQCAVRARPHRIRPKYTQDTVWLYRNGSSVDTVLVKDTTRTLYVAIPPSAFQDTLLFYTITHPTSGAVLGTDYVDQKEYRRRGGDTWLKVIWNGLGYTLAEKKRVLIRGTVKYNDAAAFYVEPSVGFRCCAWK